jgi:ATP-dependent exoDNAse (exonuclease V) beta subunit
MLTVYSASAGSGKTYNLVFDYLATCFRPNLPAFLKMTDKQHYRCLSCSGYQHILAITFTNNAGAEMKERVVKQLNRFAFAKTVEDLNCNDFDTLCRKVFGDDHSLSQEECFIFLNRNAKVFLYNILYDYARFSITTIDSFIQRVIRSSALYLNLSMNYAVQIRLNDFFRMAIEQYICELSDNKQQFDIVVKELMRQLEDNGNANINRFLSNGLGIIYYDAEKSHPYVKNFPNVADLLNVVDQWKQSYHRVLEHCKQQVKPISEQALVVFKDAEADGILPNQTYKWDRWFVQIAEDPFNLKDGFEKSRFHKEMDEQKVFSAVKKGGKSVIERCEALRTEYSEHVKDLFAQIQDIVLKSAKSYFTFQILAKNANHLLVLDALKNHIDGIKEQTDTFFLSESNPLLNDEIKSESNGEPLFEKWSFYRHFFIDEFQDTSLMQWEDLKPLIINALGENGSATLFGDVKQSIYRFRNGDAELFYRLSNKDRLQNIDSEKDIYKMVQGDSDYCFESLSTNHRSLSSVIQFNSNFFKYFSEKLGKTDYYSDVIQNIRSDKEGGLVQIFGYNKKDYKDLRLVWPECSEEFYQNVYLQLRSEEAELLYAVKDAEKRGYRFGEMAVLLSGRAKCNDFAQCLMLADIPVITSESLQLCDNASINLIISTLRLLLNSKDLLSQTVILHYFAQKFHLDMHRVLSENADHEFSEALKQRFDIHDFQSTMDGWRKNPFLITVHDIVRFYEFDVDSDPFIADFIDLAFEFSQSQAASIVDFLTWWDDINGYQETIPRLSLSGAANAVRLMTIHGSKGLEFPVVITYCTASRPRDSYYWVVDSNSGQSCYVKHEKNMQYSDFQKEFEEEEDKRNLDGLNLWYVDFTRARDMLYVLTDFSKSDNKEIEKWDIKKALLQYVGDQQNNIIAGENDIYYSGDPDWRNPQVSTQPTASQSEFKVTCSKMSFCGNNSIKVISTAVSTESQDMGTRIHHFLQKLTLFPTTLEEQLEITKDEPEEIRMRLLQLFDRTAEDPSLRPYFYPNPEDQVLNEVSIITELGDLKRPDRIVIKPDHVMIIDYKTGQEHKLQYESQLSEYKDYMLKMGYKDVRTEILYLE